MKLVTGYLRELAQATLDGWDRFWFTPADPATLGLVRIFAGAMLFYTHLVWTLDLEAFFGPQSWVSAAAARSVLAGPDERTWAWSYFWLVDSPAALWSVHLAALAVFALLAVGLFSRVVSVLAYLAAVAYANRVPGALFGLDQINCLLAMYLAIGPSGAAFSCDRWRAARRAGRPLPPAEPRASANIAIRLIQLHMCIIYFVAGLSKMQGVTWWEGTAIWLAAANLEYQSLDMTWLAGWPLLVAVMTHVAVLWELTFWALVWPRLSRPLVLALAVPLHLGIAFSLGMITFGLVMLIGCLAFVSPALVRSLWDRSQPAGGGAGEGDRKSEVADSAGRAHRSPRPSAVAATRRKPS